MIRYDLICSDGHAFDGWFSNSAAYDEQARAGLLTCPLCGTTKVDKQLMMPGINGQASDQSEASDKSEASGKSEASQPVFTGPPDPRQRMLLAMMRELRKSVEANAEYVGDRFADEARKIHYQEAEKRGIYGEASAEAAHALIDEGIEVHPLPRLPEDGN